jgi:hypothetical protein
MSKNPQNEAPRLVVVGSTNVKRATTLRWWGPKRPQQASALPPQAVRMAVMPTLSRNLWYSGATWMWNFVRRYFAPRPGAVVLSFPGKKASASVHFSRECEAAPQEGGRA